uniref:DNA/RNA-binding protein Alba-like domain-containing protein n=1 Tax=Timema bartmani TaxID=61472 RepID=A0A7R9EZT3_9NEOP|nr:unnamed protein product [Timema bartmani]
MLSNRHFVFLVPDTLDRTERWGIPVVENYSKGKNVEEALSKENIPIPDLPDNFVWMQDRDCMELSQYRDWMEVSQYRDWMEVSQYRDWMEVSQDMYWMKDSTQDLLHRQTKLVCSYCGHVDYGVRLVYLSLDAPHVVYYLPSSGRRQQDAPHVVYYLPSSGRRQQDAPHVVYYLPSSERRQQDAPQCTICPQVGAGSKMRSVLGFAMKSFKDERCIVWSGSGPAISKTISCAEIMKRRYKNTHQITKIGYRKVEEFWEPQIEDLDPLVVVREIPIIHILLSKDELNSEEPGYVHVLESVAVEYSYPVETMVQSSRASRYLLAIRPRAVVVSASGYEHKGPGFSSWLLPLLCRKVEYWGKKKLLATSMSQWCMTLRVCFPAPRYQPPGNTDVFWRAKENTPDSRRGTGKKLNKSPRVSEEQFAALGLRKGPKRAHRNPGGGGEHGKAQKGVAAVGEGSDVQDV